jgi:ABC-type multidrug transport system permease subunit
MKAWVIARCYFARMARKPLLVVLLLAIPFTLLLAEFEAFGRAPEIKQLAPVPVRLLLETQSPFAKALDNCLSQQPGRPLDVHEVTSLTAAPLDADLVEVTNAGAFLRATDHDPNKTVLESSILRTCASQQPQDTSYITVQRESSGTGSNLSTRAFVASFFPGLALFGALFLSQAMAALIWRDQERTVQQRLLTTPLSPASLVIGPILFLTTGTALALALILGLCALYSDPAALQSTGFWAIALSFGICAAGLQLIVGLLAATQRAAVAISASTTMMLAFFGGGFVPLSIYPPVLRAIAYALPNGAAQAGLTQALNGQGNTQQVALRTFTVVIWAAILISIAIILQKRKMRA